MADSPNSADVKQWAYQLGFDLIGITAAAAIEHDAFFHDWLNRGCHGTMEYLSRNVEKRLDPVKLIPGCQSIICVAMNYHTESAGKNGVECHGKIARYAWGRDYHRVVKEHLKTLADQIQKNSTSDVHLRCFVDTAPIFEKAHAARAGLGWIGKNTLLINETFGSWLVLGEIVTNLKFDYDSLVPNRCGDCRKCLDACPTGALTKPRQLDARKCISYLTIESRDEQSFEENIKTDNWLFGCDVCQEICPYNQNTPQTQHRDYFSRHRRLNPTQILKMTPEIFQSEFQESSVLRLDLDRLKSAARRLLQK